jgi:tetratricopeptide (TPR) repeat protein
MNLSRQSIHASLTCLNRIAQRNGDADGWLDQALSGRFPDLVETALDVAIETGDPIGRVLATHLAQCPDLAVIERVATLCGEGANTYSVPLQELSEIVDRKLIYFGNSAPLPEAEPQRYLAWLHLDLGSRLSAQGNHAGSVSACREAIQIFRDLVTREPDTYLPHLSQALHNFGLSLRDLKRHQEALEALQESVAIQRNSPYRQSDLFRASLASSLDALGICLHELGRSSEAARVMEEGIGLQKGISRDDLEPLWHTSSRLNLGLVLETMGRYQEAFDWTQEAVDLCRELANDRPDAFTAQLAQGLSNLSSSLAALQRSEEALSCAWEATTLFGELATERPWSFISSYARSMSQLGLLSAGGDVAYGVELCEESVRIFHDLSKQHKELHDLHLARALGNLGVTRSLGDFDPAGTEKILRRALRLLRRMSRENPGSCHLDFATALFNLASFLNSQGRKRATLHLIREAVRLYRLVSAEDPTLYAPHLAASLLRLGKALESVNRLRAAFRAYAEAAELYRGMSYPGAGPAILAPWAASLCRLIDLFRQMGQYEQAKAAQKKLSALRRRKGFPMPERP